MLVNWQYWLVFIVASVLLSECLRLFKEFTVSPNLSNGLYLLSFVLILALVLMGLLFHHYVQEKREARLANHVPLFDWFLSKLNHDKISK